MGQRKYRNLNIRGVVYPTAKDAAKALGVGVDNVLLAARSGTLDRVGLGSGPRPMRCRVGGLDFETVADAARHFGVTRPAIYKAISTGREDRVGEPQRQNPWRCRPFSIGPFSWPSMAAASRDLGFSAEYVAQAYRLNRASAKAKILRAAMRLADGRAAMRGKAA